MSVIDTNPHDAMRAAIRSARETMNAADNAANTLADILLDGGRVRLLSPYRLKRLKRALADFNMHTQRWKEPTA